MENKIQIKRAYDGAIDGDGYRVLIDRLWPRGVNKEKGAFNTWMKEIAPSTDLRKWFGHEPERFEEFKAKYIDELKEKKELLNQLKEIANTQNITLVYSAKDREHNQAVVLKEFLEEYIAK